MSAVTDLQAAVSDIIGSELPDATTKLYHGIPVWCVGDQPTVGLKPAKAHLSVLFFRGQALLDGAARMRRARWSRPARSSWPRSSSRAPPTWTKPPCAPGCARRRRLRQLMPTFTTELLQSGNNVGIVIPDAVVAELGGKRVPVVVTLNGGYSYRNTTAVMGGLNLVGLSAEHRAASGFAGGETVEVTIERDDAPREVEVPEALATALAADPVAAAAWEKLAYSHRKEHARAIDEAKAEDTRARRVAKAIAMLRGD